MGSNNKMKKRKPLITKLPSWRQWRPASCKQYPKTLSFRAGSDEEIFKTVNSVFLDPDRAAAVEKVWVETPNESWFTNSSESASFSTESDDYHYYHNNNGNNAGQFDGEALETVLGRGVKSERLIFEAGDFNSASSSILEKAKRECDSGVFKESMVVAMESEDPFWDFRMSMEEMVESFHGNWDGLEEMLSWYLRVNEKNNHGFIVAAFVDMLVHLAAAETTAVKTADGRGSSESTSYGSATSSFATSSSPSCSLCQSRNEIIEEEVIIK